MRARTRSGLRLVALAAVVLTAGAGCSSGPAAHKSTTGSTHVDQRLHADLPAPVRTRGMLRIVTDASYAPASSFAPDGRTIVGFEPDLGAVLGSILGVKVVFTNEDFGTLPRLVTTGRADLIMSAMTDTAERERQLDFVNYFSAGTSLLVRRGNPNGISDLGSLCGERVAVEGGTVQADLLTREQAHCGARPMVIVTEPTNDDAVLQLRTGRVAALPMDYPPADNLTTQPRTRGYYQLASTVQYEPGLYGIGVAKSDAALRDTVAAALDEAIASGAYRAVLLRWSVGQGAVVRSSINAAGQG